MKDTTIFYQGGSGGFALYYYLLLSGQYQYNIETVKEMISNQFPTTLVQRLNHWKDKEYWPNNLKLKQQSGNKLFLICNPLFCPEMYATNKMVSDNTYKILLYTDIHLQLRLAYEKNAYWFTTVSRAYFNAPTNTNEYLRQILSTKILFNRVAVDPVVPQIINEFNPNQIITLAQLVKSQPFGAPNQYQIEFLKYWYSLQPKKAKMLIDNTSI